MIESDPGGAVIVPGKLRGLFVADLVFDTWYKKRRERRALLCGNSSVVVWWGGVEGRGGEGTCWKKVGG